MFSHPLFPRFENVLRTGENQWEWCLRERDWIVRPQGADETLVWFLLGRANVGRNLLQPAPYHDPTFKAQQVIRTRSFWRWWQLESGEECFLRAKYGIFRAHTGEFVRFDYPSRFSDVAYAKADEIETFLQSEELRPELEAAQRWSQTPLRERVRQLLTLRGGSFDEFEALIQGALVLSGAQEARFEMRDVMIMPGRILLSSVSPWRQAHPVDKFFDILNAHFHLERTTREWRGHDEFGDPDEVPYPIYTSSQPNQHERLEAQLNWRDFLCDKLPEDEITRLLHI